MTVRTALITGAARRIGAAIAHDLAREGYRIIAHYHRSEADAAELASLIRAAGGVCETIQADLSRREEIESLMPRCTAAFGPVHVLINNAATFFNDVIDTVTWDSLHAHMTPNFVAPLMISRDFVRLFGTGDQGCIINLLDQKLDNLNPDFLSYTLSKIALQGVTQLLAMSCGPNIRVNGVAPGITLISGKQTEESFQRAWRATPLNRSSTPAEIASCVRFILSTPSITGQTIVLDGGESLRGRARDVAFEVGGHT